MCLLLCKNYTLIGFFVRVNRTNETNTRPQDRRVPYRGRSQKEKKPWKKKTKDANDARWSAAASTVTVIEAAAAAADRGKT